jgi:hypothetical protein
MNKKQKILTILALIAFSAIIALHYGWWPCHYAPNAFRMGDPAYWGWWPWPIIEDVRIPLFVLAVFYVGLFFFFGGKDADPVPRLPRDWRRIKIIGVVIAGLVVIVLAFGVVAYSVNVATRYHAFTNQLSAVRDIHIGDSREEVKYRLGVPPHVLGPEEGKFRGPEGESRGRWRLLGLRSR